NFVDTGFKWPQPNGNGSAVTITYSYSNLLDESLHGISAKRLKQASEEALGRWAAVAPLHFVEKVDSGPNPSDANYGGQGRPHIRIGAHTIDGANGPILAHAYLPFSAAAGLSGDVHFDIDEEWGAAQGGFFLEVILHELGHSLGLGHELVVNAIMNPTIQNRFNGLGESFLFTDDINGIRAIYGTGVGSVTPLEDPEGEGDPPLNDVTAEYDADANTLRIVGDGAANSILLRSTNSFIVVYGLNGTTVNGDSMAIIIASGERHAVCKMGGGGDLVVAFRLQLSSLDCELDADDDVLAIIHSRMQELTATGGPDTDHLVNFASTIGNLIVSGFESSF
ncbi:MAG: matrixin family metalloprotease, partial [Planctomycetes bacterium]|nr:matrixin family metalloprotease [Planctomycetota bacterium]